MGGGYNFLNNNGVDFPLPREKRMGERGERRGCFGFIRKKFHIRFVAPPPPPEISKKKVISSPRGPHTLERSASY